LFGTANFFKTDLAAIGVISGSGLKGGTRFTQIQAQKSDQMESNIE